MDVAVVDYQSPDAPKRFTDSLRNTGFAVLTNHPIQYDMVQRLQNEWLNFFRTGNKWDYLPGEGGQDGYRPLEKLSKQLVLRFQISKSIFTGTRGVVSQQPNQQVRPLCIKRVGHLRPSYLRG